MCTVPLPAAPLTRGYWIALASAAILIRYLTQTFALPALVLAFWRDTFVVLALLPALASLQPQLLRIERRHILFFILYGCVLAFFNATWTLSVALNGAAIATVLAYCSAGFTVLLGWRFYNERLDGGTLVTVALCLSGCALVSGAVPLHLARTNVAGIVTGILSGLAYAFYTLMGRAASRRGLDPWTTLLYTFGGAAVVLLALNLFPRPALPGAALQPGDLLWLGEAAQGWGALALLAAGPTVIGFGLYNVSLVYLPSSVANLIVSTEPVFTAAIAYTLLRERLDAQQLAGSALILGAVLLLRIRENV